MKPACTHAPLNLPALAISASQLEAAGEMFHALRDPARLRLLILLSQGERCVTELVYAEQAKLGSISARLKVLHGARLVKRRRVAKHVFYALSDDHVLTLLDSVLAHAAEPTQPASS
ncbi:ArsR family transcriptional regulator [Caballeronia sordidicola]|uniref:ArsR family transcriptional regulator n=1 Tax=Caballeronia sordidicola TaxID=196367 RepID=A0A158IDT2_CABSO|nr:metalloregulator ArsR/SmtB family transcription factor [Caballeronia sordidicola]SAL54617.1 ArsR family transcriptional regulator [Caballeronia sordidicola]